MDSAVSELLSIPAHTLRRIRGGKNIQKSHLGLEQQLRQIAITSIPLEARSERDGKTEGKVPNTEAETIQDSKEAQRVQKATALVHTQEGSSVPPFRRCFRHIEESHRGPQETILQVR